MFILSAIFLVPHDKTFEVLEVKTPIDFVLRNKVFKINGFETFDKNFSDKNKSLALNLNITEEEAFILGNLAQLWAENLMKGRDVFIKNNSDLIYYRQSYITKFKYSGYCLVNGKPFSEEAFQHKLGEIRRAKYKVLDLESETIYEINNKNVQNLKDFVILRKSLFRKIFNKNIKKIPAKTHEFGNLKVFFTDSTTKLFPDRKCSTLVCQEILSNINQAKNSIDIAIYGYSTTPVIEEALKSAIDRGVKVRLVYDLNSKGVNIYPNTNQLIKIIKSCSNDGNSLEVGNIMHNKFYIFDESTLITGSANLSHTDMSGFNSNSIIKIKSPEVAQIYKKEFEQMFSGKYHSDKTSTSTKNISVSGIKMQVYFSPQDKSITNAVIPLIRNAKNYIYIPTFVLTEKRVTDELIKAKQRGVDVKIIIDALNASIKHSKHNELRAGGVLVKTENYAGKMHSKSMIVDDRYTIIGSMNFSYSGENKNDENLIVIESPEITNAYKEFFLYQWSQIDDKWLEYNVRAEGIHSIGSCSDGIDNNYDGFIDADDPACKK